MTERASLQHEEQRRPQVLYRDLFDEHLLTEYERASLQRRLAAVQRQLRGVVEAGRHLRIPRRGGPPPRGPYATTDQNAASFLALLKDNVERQRHELGLKSAVVNHVLDELARTYLWTNLSTLPAFHELTVLVPYWSINRTLATKLEELSAALVQQLLHGIVLSLQQVREEILLSDEVYLAHCACRSSGIVDDLEQGGEVFTIVGDAEGRLLLDRLVDRYESLDGDRRLATTGPKLRALLDELVDLRRRGSDRYHLSTLLRRTYFSWEILPVKPGFTTNWVRSLRNNDKCEPLDKELMYELVNIFFHGRGAIFNSMKCVGSQYTICTCPTPENDGGCVLTNWYYYGRMNSSLIPADDHYGRLRGLDGGVLPCRYFPVRARRECIGCGCNHSLRGPRDLVASLADADALLDRYHAGESIAPETPKT
jgi:hypothetical protein